MRCWKDLRYALLVVALVASLLPLCFSSHNYNSYFLGASVGVTFPVSDIESLFVAHLHTIMGCSGVWVPLAALLDELMEGIEQFHHTDVGVMRWWLWWY